VLRRVVTLSQAYVAAGKTAPAFAEPISMGATIKASHLTELRSLLLAIL
jgi:hypothetical protein